MNKVVVIGCDGATWDVLQPLIDKEMLPGFAALQKRGATGKLQSTIPPLTAPGWTTGVTGRNPGKHNIYDFVRPSREDYDLHLTSRRDRRCRALWNYVSDAGGRVLVMNVPHTYPPEEVNGLFVSGMGTPKDAETFTYPSSLKERIKGISPSYRVSLETDTIECGDMAAFVRELATHTTTQFQTFTTLYAQEQPDFAMYVFDEMDRLMHFFWRYYDAAHPSYERTTYSTALQDHLSLVDERLQSFLSTLDDSTHVVVFSDHGFRALHSDVYLNNWLRDEGYLATHDGEEITTKVTGVVRVKAAIVRLMEKIGVWEYYRRYRLRHDTLSVVWYLRHVDWSRTRAYLYSMSGQSIRFNVRGREACGCVAPSDVDALAEELTEKLLSLRDPRNGMPLVERVERGSEVFRGPYVENAPDIVVLPAAGYAWQTGFGDALVTDAEQYGLARSGDHDPFGIVGLAGPAVRAGKVHGYSLQDITPTVLYLMGLPVPRDMDGVVMTHALHDGYMTEHAVERCDDTPWRHTDEAPTEEEERILTEQLKALGYM